MGRLVLRVSYHEYAHSFVWSFRITETSLALLEGYGKGAARRDAHQVGSSWLGSGSAITEIVKLRTKGSERRDLSDYEVT